MLRQVSGWCSCCIGANGGGRDEDGEGDGDGDGAAAIIAALAYDSRLTQLLANYRSFCYLEFVNNSMKGSDPVDIFDYNWFLPSSSSSLQSGQQIIRACRCLSGSVVLLFVLPPPLWALALQLLVAFIC
uniref:Uncharacterized protein n=1 Tax=Glossina austeni TaxID=7395 RepID=A0A1A9UIK9_GLOAU